MSAKPKILAIISYKVFPPVMGGQKGVTLFYKYLKAYFDIFIATSRDNKENAEQNVTPFLFANKLLFLNIFYLYRLKKEIEKKKIDVIIIEHSYPAFIGIILRKWTGIPFIIHAHNLEADRFRQMKKWWWRFYATYEKMAMSFANLVFFISEEDRQKAVTSYKLKEQKSSVITYGIELQPFNNQPSFTGNFQSTKILYFNGTLDYQPNYEALKVIIDIIDPLLQQRIKDYKIIISGTAMPKEIYQSIDKNERIEYIGLVNNVAEKYREADLFLNPVLNDSGIKTKVVEAIANYCTVISTISGATSINKKVCGDKLITVVNGDWTEFVNQIILQLNLPKRETPNSFFEYYFWENIAKKAARKIQYLLKNNA